MGKLALAFLLVSVASCAKNSNVADNNVDLGDGGTTPAAPDSGAGSTRADCADSTKDVFLVTADATLYQFHPPTAESKALGHLPCGAAAGATPTSMAVDRKGFAWVRYSDGTVWKADTQEPHLLCEATPFAPPASGGFLKFGMGFASETKGSSNEGLFVSDDDGNGLGKLDTSTYQIRYVGPFTGSVNGARAELTGTGDGKLYGVFTTSPVQIAEISKGTGQTLSALTVPNVSTGDAWAFAFYGGDFYLYTLSVSGSGLPQSGGAGSDVTRYRPADASTTVIKQGIGFTVVGAGVSTCAPTTTP